MCVGTGHLDRLRIGGWGLKYARRWSAELIVNQLMVEESLAAREIRDE